MTWPHSMLLYSKRGFVALLISWQPLGFKTIGSSNRMLQNAVLPKGMLLPGGTEVKVERLDHLGWAWAISDWDQLSSIVCLRMVEALTGLDHIPNLSSKADIFPLYNKRTEYQISKCIKDFLLVTVSRAPHLWQLASGRVQQMRSWDRDVGLENSGENEHKDMFGLMAIW